jgi:hypothetical protein
LTEELTAIDHLPAALLREAFNGHARAMAWAPTTLRPGLWSAPAERSGDGAFARLQTVAQTPTSGTSSESKAA